MLSKQSRERLFIVYSVAYKWFKNFLNNWFKELLKQKSSWGRFDGFSFKINCFVHIFFQENIFSIRECCNFGVVA